MSQFKKKLTQSCHCALLLADGGGGLEGGAQDDVLTVGDASLDPATAVRAGPKVFALNARFVREYASAQGMQRSDLVLPSAST